MGWGKSKPIPDKSYTRNLERKRRFISGLAFQKSEKGLEFNFQGGLTFDKKDIFETKEENILETKEENI